jgi:RNA polymerase sigma-70 factor (sigma-E family)
MGVADNAQPSALSLPAVGAANEETLANLYARHHGASVRLAYLLCGEEQEAHDVVQDAFVRLISRPVALRDPSKFPAYLRRAVVTTALSRRRSATRERLRMERSAGSIVAPAAFEQDEELWAAVQRLSSRQRAAIVLRFWLDLSEADVAAALGCRPGTVKSLTARGLAALRSEVDDVVY